MIDYESYSDFLKPPGTRPFFVVRDPRDLVISRYYSARYSHPDNKGILEVRKVLESMSEEDGIIYTIRERFEPIAVRINSWYEAGEIEGVPIVRFEALTGEKQVTVWTGLLDRLGMTVGPDVVEKVLSFYSMKNMRPPGTNKSIKSAKYRSGESGEWREHFTPAVSDAFYSLYGDLPSKLGYE
ncbi:sulfotransferase domain-containing protein [Algiphilus aromaticivorans]|uniref:sulfotransferase domain-containing protein n=1 Tax=Algiphilus aromaticivorans TaxID=382454 RepID=UPI0018DC6021|nr:sulfotransferase domain-containing protein [Algiphilus aromaticivorans]